jgi:serine/threonine-protein kinase
MDSAERTLPSSIGRYEIERLLGRGAMGRVLLARDPVLSRQVAVKLLRDDLRLEPEQLRGLFDRMRQEARASARVTHPNIVGLYDMGEDEQLGLFLVFEYAEGITLKDRLKRGPLAAIAAARLAREIGDALSTAHAAGVLHRDIKPENIILTATGSKIADFGIARVPDSTLTRDGGLLGTPAYSAPESVAKGLFSSASDQFSMAATLYEAISQCRAFPGEDAVTVASRITIEEAPPIAAACGLSPHVDEVLTRGLAKEPGARYESAREFGHALAEALELLPRSSLPTMPDERHSRSQPPSAEARTRLLAGGIALGALMGVAAMQLTSGLRQPEVVEAEPLASAPSPLAVPHAHFAMLAELGKSRSKPAASARTSASGRPERTGSVDLALHTLPPAGPHGPAALGENGESKEPAALPSALNPATAHDASPPARNPAAPDENNAP